MKVEGKVVSDDVSVLERECLACLEEKKGVLLDLSGVTYVDARGVTMLDRLVSEENVRVSKCSSFIEQLLKCKEWSGEKR